MLAGIPRIRNTKSELEIKRFQQLISEEMLLYHPKLIHWLTPNGKLNPAKYIKSILIPKTFNHTKYQLT